MKKYKIAVVGMGYVGLAMALLLAQHHKVYALDNDKKKIDKMKEKEYPAIDKKIQEFLNTKALDITPTIHDNEAYEKAEFVVIAVPTDYNKKTKELDTKVIKDIINNVIEYNKEAIIIIKSTVPIGYTSAICEEIGKKDIIFCPEFLREGYALEDNLYPSRIIVGVDLKEKKVCESGYLFANLLKKVAIKKEVEILLMDTSEAEAVKLFTNAYLAMRISYFNELDTYTEVNGLNSRQIIKAVCMDSRIGDYYNNPSFGYGGYCLPKDTMQLISNYDGIPNKLINAIMHSNRLRKDFIVKQIVNRKSGTIGIYRLLMKSSSDNIRESSMIDIVEMLAKKNSGMVIYEPMIKSRTYLGIKVVKKIKDFKRICDLIICNRYDEELDDVKNKVYTRDVFNRD